METPNPPRPWLVCIRVNSDSKAYFDRQLTSFELINPLLVTWADDRPEDPEQNRRRYVMSRPWDDVLPIRGGFRLRALKHQVKEKLGYAPLAANNRELREWQELAKSDPPSVLYVHTGFAALRILPLAKSLGVPIVVHFHGLDINSFDPLYQRQITRHLKKLDHVIVVGKWMIPWFTERGFDPDKITALPVGAPIKPQEKAAEINPNSDGHFIAISRMVAYKGLDRTLEAYAKLLKTHPKARLTIVGNGPLEAELHQQAQSLGLDPKEIFTGSLPASEVQKRLIATDALVHHALDYPDGPEAWGVVVNEAMAASRPVVVTRCGGMIEQVIDGETGFLVDQEDTDTMAARMGELIDNPDLRAEMGKKARRRVEEHFDAVKLARDVERLLMRVTGVSAPNAHLEQSNRTGTA